MEKFAFERLVGTSACERSNVEGGDCAWHNRGPRRHCATAHDPDGVLDSSIPRRREEFATVRINGRFMLMTMLLFGIDDKASETSSLTRLSSGCTQLMGVSLQNREKMNVVVTKRCCVQCIIRNGVKTMITTGSRESVFLVHDFAYTAIAIDGQTARCFL